MESRSSPVQSGPVQSSRIGRRYSTPALSVSISLFFAVQVSCSRSDDDGNAAAPDKTEEREDDVLPNSALDAVFAAGESTAKALRTGGSRAVVEIFYGTLYV